MATNTGYKEHAYAVRVFYEDTDAAGVVYHAGYLRFAERGRTEMLRGLGFEHAKLLETQGIAFAVTRLEIDYLRPAKLDDLLTVRSRFEGIGGAVFSMRQEVLRGDEVLARLALDIACVGRNGRATRLPEGLRRVFDAEMNKQGKGKEHGDT